MQFGTFLEISGEIFNTVHFPNSMRNNIIRRNGLYLLHGYVRADYGYFTLEVFDCTYCPRRPDSRYTDIKPAYTEL
jgi:DNA polymerase-3 subunit alpha